MQKENFKKKKMPFVRNSHTKCPLREFRTKGKKIILCVECIIYESENFI